MSTVVLPGSQGGINISLGSLITTAVNIAILYFLFSYVRRNWDIVKGVFRVPDIIDIKPVKSPEPDMPMAMPDAAPPIKERYTNEPMTSVDVFN